MWLIFKHLSTAHLHLNRKNVIKIHKVSSHQPTSSCDIFSSKTVLAFLIILLIPRTTIGFMFTAKFSFCPMPWIAIIWMIRLIFLRHHNEQVITAPFTSPGGKSVSLYRDDTFVLEIKVLTIPGDGQQKEDGGEEELLIIFLLFRRAASQQFSPPSLVSVPSLNIKWRRDQRSVKLELSYDRLLIHAHVTAAQLCGIYDAPANSNIV